MQGRCSPLTPMFTPTSHWHGSSHPSTEHYCSSPPPLSKIVLPLSAAGYYCPAPSLIGHFCLAGTIVLFHSPLSTIVLPTRRYCFPPAGHYFSILPPTGHCCFSQPPAVATLAGYYCSAPLGTFVSSHPPSGFFCYP